MQSKLKPLSPRLCIPLFLCNLWPISVSAAPQTKTKSARAFVQEANRDLKALYQKSNAASWIADTYITNDTEFLSSLAQTELLAFTTDLMREATLYGGQKLDGDTKRQIDLLKIASTPSPTNRTQLEEMTGLATKMSAIYGKQKICADWASKSSYDQDKDGCLALDELEILLAEEKDPATLLQAWHAWHEVGKALKPLYKRYVELKNIGAREGGYKDTSEAWRTGYEMSPAAFESDLERLWQQVSPLYEDLHCLVKRKVDAFYPGSAREDGRIPAHLLGNMWAQDWSYLYDKLEPFPGESKLDVTKALQDKGYDALKMTQLSESFFTSMGFDALPKSFYERSMLTKPRDREVVCHASAWDVSTENDLRIKMCIQINEENLITIHHELGHVFYYQSYYRLPVIYQQGAHDGFHEAIGDAIALSVNAKYLAQVGLIAESGQDSDKALINLQFKSALSKIAFLPFGYLMDKWRWRVYEGKTKPDQYNATWWKLRGDYQGIAAPEKRDESYFDAGAKYHIPADVPYARYFMATILQFQMFKAMCDQSGHKGPLANCSLYGQKGAGAKLKAMLALGSSKPWPDALKVLTGENRMDAQALLEYFGPLHAWLKEQNKDQACGWDRS